MSLFTWFNYVKLWGSKGIKLTARTHSFRCYMLGFRMVRKSVSTRMKLAFRWTKLHIPCHPTHNRHVPSRKLCHTYEYAQSSAITNDPEIVIFGADFHTQWKLHTDVIMWYWCIYWRSRISELGILGPSERIANQVRILLKDSFFTRVGWIHSHTILTFLRILVTSVLNSP